MSYIKDYIHYKKCESITNKDELKHTFMYLSKISLIKFFIILFFIILFVLSLYLSYQEFGIIGGCIVALLVPFRLFKKL